LTGVFPQDFGSVVERERGWLGDGGSFGGNYVPALAKKVHLVVGVDPAFQVERQIEVQKRCQWTGAQDGALILQGFFPRRIGDQAAGSHSDCASRRQHLHLSSSCSDVPSK